MLLTIILVASVNFAPVDCELVRGYVLQHGRKEALAWAVGQVLLGNYSWQQLRAAKRCLDVLKGKS